MSFILDALKKSDAERRLGSTPTLGGQTSSAGAASVSELGPLTWVVSSVLAVTLLVIGWVWFEIPDPIAVSAVTQVDSPIPPLAGQDTSQTEAVDGQVNEPESSAGQSQTGTPPEPSRELAVVRSFTAEDKADEVPPDGQLVDQPEVAPANPAEQTTTPAEQIAVVRARPSKKTDTPAKTDTRPAGEPIAKRSDSQAVQSPPEAPAQPEPIFRFELPADIRSQLPEFNVAVQVYDDKPVDRFAIINGQRLREGDALKAGLVLREIRRDDLVFSYRSYNFKVTP